MSTENLIDVNKVLEASTQVKTLRQLESEGRKAVKVVHTSTISQLISNALESVIAERSLEVAEKEKNEIVEATGEEFKRLLRDAEQERKRSHEHLEQLRTREKEFLQVKHQLELSELRHEEDVRLLEEQQSVVEELKARVKELKEELEGLLDHNRMDLRGKEDLLKELKERREENQHLREEIAGLRAHGGSAPSHAPLGDAEMMKHLEAMLSKKMDGLAAQLADRFTSLPGGVQKKPVEAAKIVLDSLFKERDSVESNIEKVQVKSAEGTGIGRNLARLKSLHKKGLSRGDTKATEGMK